LLATLALVRLSKCFTGLPLANRLSHFWSKCRVAQEDNITPQDFLWANKVHEGKINRQKGTKNILLSLTFQFSKDKEASKIKSPSQLKAKIMLTCEA